MANQNYNYDYSKIQNGLMLESKDEMLAGLQAKAKEFIACCIGANVDVSELVMDDLYSFNNDLNQDLRVYSLKWLDDCVPKIPKTFLKNGQTYQIPNEVEPMFQIDKSEKMLFVQTVSLMASTMESEGVKMIKDNLEICDVNKFVKMVNILFDKLYKCYDEEETKKAKVFLIHSMVNTKRLLCGKSDEYQQIFGLWSTDKGTGKDVFFKSMIYAITRNGVTSRNMSDLVRNFNYELAKTQGYFYLEELTEVDKKLKNQIKQIITADCIPIELKGKEVANMKRKFTLCISANEEPSKMFSDENKERRAGFARIVGTNYFYKSEYAESSMYLLWRYFMLMWLYCPIEYFYNTSDIKRMAETDSKRNITSNYELIVRLKEIASRDKDDVSIPQEKQKISIAQKIVNGARFSRRDLTTVFEKESGVSTYEPSRLLKSSFVSEQKGSYFKLDYQKAIETEEELKIELEETSFKTPSVTIDIDKLCECIVDDVEFEFPEPKFEAVKSTYTSSNGKSYNLFDMIGGDIKVEEKKVEEMDFKEKFLEGVNMSQYDRNRLDKEYDIKSKILDDEIENSGMVMDKFGNFRSKTFSNDFT